MRPWSLELGFRTYAPRLSSTWSAAVLRASRYVWCQHSSEAQRQIVGDFRLFRKIPTERRPRGPLGPEGPISELFVYLVLKSV